MHGIGLVMVWLGCVAGALALWLWTEVRVQARLPGAGEQGVLVVCVGAYFSILILTLFREIMMLHGE